MAPQPDSSALSTAGAEKPSSVRQDLELICRALMFFVGAALPIFFAGLAGTLRVLKQDWQSVGILAVIALEAALFGHWISGRRMQPRLAGFASGALGLEVGYVAFMLASSELPSMNEVVVLLVVAPLVIALCHGFASWRLFLRARESSWKNAIGTFLAGAAGLASVVYTLLALLPTMPDDGSR
jgi:hypothetical protein